MRYGTFEGAAEPAGRSSARSSSVVKVVVSSCVAGFMFGYDTACISSILVFIDIPLTSFQKEIVTGITSVGSLAGSVASSQLADVYGRKMVIIACCLLFIVSAVQLSLCNSYAWLVVGRLVTGLAIGAASMVVPVYISEIAPSDQRGRLITINSMATTGGQLIANLIAESVKSWHHINWRIMFGVSSLPCLIFICLLKSIPESPRFLVMNQQFQEAANSLLQLSPELSEQETSTAIEQIQSQLLAKQSTKLSSYLVIGIVLMFFQQSCGFNSLMYYGPTIFNSFVKDPIIISILISGINFGFTLIVYKLIDKIGRKKLLINTVWLMFVSMISFGVFLERKHVNLSILSMLIFVSSYSSGLGTVPWLSVELLPQASRSFGSGLIACTNWFANSLISLSFLSAVDKFSIFYTSLIFGLNCLICWIFVIICYPEVNGLSLEEISSIL